MVEEIWKDIEGYEGKYQVSNMGRVKNIRRNYILTPSRTSWGYLQVTLDNTTKHHRVHTLVANAFIPNPDNYTEINHKDENKQNNFADNLEWCTRRYNLNYGNRNAKISQNNRSKVSILCIETGVVYPSIKEASKELGISYYSLRKCLHNKLKTAGGYHWQKLTERHEL